MAKEKPNKWTREQSFLELHGGDIGIITAALFFLLLMLTILFVPWHVPSLSGLVASGQSVSTTVTPLTLQKGETEMDLFPPKPAQSRPAKKK